LLLLQVEVSPPKAKADACVPAPANLVLAVFKPVGFETQLVPSYNSVAAELVGGPPPEANAAV
jgi:hypothetical protein